MLLCVKKSCFALRFHFKVRPSFCRFVILFRFKKFDFFNLGYPRSMIRVLYCMFFYLLTTNNNNLTLSNNSLQIINTMMDQNL